MKSDMGITPNVPGTGPVTDVPQPSNDPYGNEPGAPDIEPGGIEPGQDPGEGRNPADTARTGTSQSEVNPFSGSPTGGTGGIDPSAPTTGTEDWGRRTGEGTAVSNSAGQNRRSTTMANVEERNLHFRCSDIHPECKWEASGRSEGELMPQIEHHGREKHGLQSLGQEIKDKIRNAIQRHAA